MMQIISQPYTQHNPRLRVVGGIVGVCLAILLLALARVQVVHGDRFGDREQAQSLRRIRVPSTRGDIVDRHGVVLAHNRPSYDIVIYLEELRRESKQQDIVRAASSSLVALSAELGMPLTLGARDVRIHYAQRRPLPLPIWRDLREDRLAAFAERASQLPGADLMVTPVREYPLGALAAHVLGFVGKADPQRDAELENYYYYQPDSIGRQGVERSYDEFLRGAPGGRTIRVSPTGTMVGEVGVKPATRGNRLVLTLDARVQHLVEAALQGAALPAGKPRRGAAVVLDTRTGEVLALASLPTFDPNLFNPATPGELIRGVLQDPDQPMLNRAYGGLYAPGSIFKPITLLAGLSSGRMAPQHRVTCEGSLQIGNWQRPFGCWNRRGHGALDALGAMKQSCDVWFYVEGMKTGVEEIEKIATAFGLGEPTGFDVGNEYSGLVPTAAWKRRQRGERWWDGDTAQLSIGQSFLQVTPLQMAVATAAFANGGRVLRPFLVKQVVSPAGAVLRENQPVTRKQVRVAQSDMEIVRRTMLASVRDSDGTAHRAAVRGLSIAGKTGTAEFDTAAGRINRVWFVGFAPYEQPQVAVVVMFEDADSGGHTAAPVAGQIFAGLFGKEVERVGARNEYGD